MFFPCMNISFQVSGMTKTDSLFNLCTYIEYVLYIGFMYMLDTSVDFHLVHSFYAQFIFNAQKILYILHGILFLQLKSGFNSEYPDRRLQQQTTKLKVNIQSNPPEGVRNVNPLGAVKIQLLSQHNQQIRTFMSIFFALPREIKPIGYFGFYSTPTYKLRRGKVVIFNRSLVQVDKLYKKISYKLRKAILK